MAPNCVECTKEFVKKNYNHKFCSEKCSDVYNMRKTRIKLQSPEMRAKRAKYNRKYAREYDKILNERKRQETARLKAMPPEELLAFVKRSVKASDEMRFETDMSNYDKKVPVRFIIGERPGLRRSGAPAYKVWHESRTGTFMRTVVGRAPSVFFTNIVNSYDTSPEALKRGLEQLRNDIDTHKPVKLLVFGKFAATHVNNMISSGLIGAKVYIRYFDHPSYILRFMSEKKVKRYVESVRAELMLECDK